MYGCRRIYVRRSPAVRFAYCRFYGCRYPVRMNDSEIRVMSFTQNIERTLTVAAGRNGVIGLDSANNYLSGFTFANVISDFGRIYFVGMMYDRFRFRSVFVSVRPKVMFSAVGVFNYTFHFAWDRYTYDLSPADVTVNLRVVTDDPSAKMIVWSSGGNVFTLTHRVYSTYRDRYQYIGINHEFPTNGDPANWLITPLISAATSFVLVFRYVLDVGFPVASDLPVNLIFQYRYIIEFMGVAFMVFGSDAPVSGRIFGVMPFASVDEDPEA